jgi:hypothetical protein
VPPGQLARGLADPRGARGSPGSLAAEATAHAARDGQRHRPRTSTLMSLAFRTATSLAVAEMSRDKPTKITQRVMYHDN